MVLTRTAALRERPSRACARPNEIGNRLWQSICQFDLLPKRRATKADGVRSIRRGDQRPPARLPAGPKCQRVKLPARESDRIAHSWRCYVGAELRLLSHAGARSLADGRQTGQGQDPKRGRHCRHKGRSHWKNRRVKRQHRFDPRKGQLAVRYAPPGIAAVMARTARAPGELSLPAPGPRSRRITSGETKGNAALIRRFRPRPVSPFARGAPRRSIAFAVIGHKSGRK
jgi:hypothetical protein